MRKLDLSHAAIARMNITFFCTEHLCRRNVL